MAKKIFTVVAYILIVGLAAGSAIATSPDPIKPVDNSWQVKLISDRDAKKQQPAAPAPAPSPPAPTQEPEPAPDLSLKPVSNGVLMALNQERVRVGLPALSESGYLNGTAAAHSARMAGGYGHNHSSYPGEIIGYNCGYADHEGTVVSMWFNSPAHYALITGHYTAFGYGMAQAGGCYYFTVHFS